MSHQQNCVCCVCPHIPDCYEEQFCGICGGVNNE